MEARPFIDRRRVRDHVGLRIIGTEDKMNGSSVTPCTLTVEQAAEFAGCSVSTIYHAKPFLVCRRVGRHMMINEASLHRWLESKTTSSLLDMEAAADRMILKGYRPA